MMSTDRKIDITFKSKKRVFNEAYIPHLDGRKRYEIYYGGAGAGKSHFVAQKIIYRVLKERGHKFLVVRKVARTNRHSTHAQLVQIINDWKLRPLFKIDKTELDITLTLFGKEDNKILFSGLDDVEKLKSIVGITDIWIEEATEISLDDFVQLDLRLRTKTKNPNQIFLTFNPVSSYSWIKNRFFDDPEAEKNNVTILRTTHADNRYIGEDYKDVLEALKEQDKTYYQIYALGEWGTPRGVIYENWSIATETPISGELLYGLDFGYNNPTALVEIRVNERDVYLKELLYQTHMTNSELIERLKALKVTGRIYCDCAEPNRIQELRSAGFVALPSRKDVVKGIDYVKSLRLHVDAESSNLIKELTTYKWREDKSGVTIDEPLKFQDHLCDAVRYALYTGKRTEYLAW